MKHRGQRLTLDTCGGARHLRRVIIGHVALHLLTARSRSSRSCRRCSATVSWNLRRNLSALSRRSASVPAPLARGVARELEAIETQVSAAQEPLFVTDQQHFGEDACRLRGQRLKLDEVPNVLTGRSSFLPGEFKDAVRACCKYDQGRRGH